ncbi:MAG: biopolymer transporter ExbD [Chromatiales bacterium]|jgi:biopolymer transport protein ExbD|nr:biopolymer transporter ExbD [Chromatiales bacterium]MDX9767487.1 biopolymer transporter ExbD [Ectothiorhodospiraceae bacterium]
MKFAAARRERDGLSIVDLTPLIDVVFLLLIFFMVTTTFNRHSELKIQLPEASTAVQETQRQTVELLIDVRGHYYIDGKELVSTRLDTVIAALRQAADNDAATPLIVRADAKTPHQAVVTALDAASRLGMTRLSIATSRGEEND